MKCLTPGNVLFSTMLLLLLSSCSTTIQSLHNHVEDGSRKAMTRAAENQGIDIVEDEIATVSQGNLTFSATSIAGVENIAPAEYASGVDIGFAYLHPPSDNIPAGYYTLRATANIQDVGTTDGRLQLINSSGEAVASASGEFEVFSMTPTDMNGWTGNVFTPNIRYDESMIGGIERPELVIIFWCTNGVHGIIILRFEF